MMFERPGVPWLGIGGLLVLFAASVAVWRARLARRAVTAPGRIVALGNESDAELPVVTFETEPHAGQPARSVTFQSRYSHGSHEVGQIVPVYYDPARPASATIQSPAAARTLVLVTGGAGVLMVGSGLFLLLK